MRVSKTLRLAGNYLSLLLNYLLAGGSLLATVILLLVLYQLISPTRASYPSLPFIARDSLAKPLFVKSIPIQTPKSFQGTALSVSPDGKRIGYWGHSDETRERGFYIAKIDSEEDNLIWPFVLWHSWSPDSTKLLLQAREDESGLGTLAIANVDEKSASLIFPAVEWLNLLPQTISPGSPLPAGVANWTPDGKALLYVQPKASDGLSELWRFDLESRQKQRLAALPKEPDKPNTIVRNLSVSPDGKKVAFINADRSGSERSSTWWIMNLDGTSPLSLLKRTPESGFVQHWLWSPDSRQLMYDVKLPGDGNYQPTTLWIMNNDGTGRRQVSTSDNVEGFALSPKGHWALYGKESHLWLTNLDNGEEEQITFGDDSEGNPLWLPNGDVLYHLRVGSVSSLRLLDYVEPSEVPGLVPPTPTKAP